MEDNVDSLLRRIRSNLLDCLNYRLHFKHRSDFHGEMEKYFWSACAENWEKPLLLIKKKIYIFLRHHVEF